MAYSQNELERLHNNGKIPDIFYYQLSDKSPEQKYEEQKQNLIKNINNKRGENILIVIEEKELEQTIENAVNDILKGL